MILLMSALFAVEPPTNALYAYGPLGVFAVFATLAIVYFFKVFMKDYNDVKAQRDSLLEEVFTKVLPAIIKNTEVLENRQALDRDLIDAVKRSNELREETRKAFEDSKHAFQSFKFFLEHGGGNSRAGGT